MLPVLRGVLAHIRLQGNRYPSQGEVRGKLACDELRVHNGLEMHGTLSSTD